MATSNFDPSYFRHPHTGKFRFPAYTLDWKGLVQIRDNTSYKKQLFRNLSAAEIDRFDLQQFEKAKIVYALEVESFESFFNRFPLSCFNKGITRSDLDFYFSMYEDYLADEKTDYIPAFNPSEIEAAIEAGLLTLDYSPDKVKSNLRSLGKNALLDYSLEHNIPPATTVPKIIEQLMKSDVPLPEVPAKLTNKLKEVHLDFVHFYLHDIIKHTAHFHPALLHAVWSILKEDGSGLLIPKLAAQILKKPYWLSEDCYELPPVADTASMASLVFTYQPPEPAIDLDFSKKQVDPNDVNAKDTYWKARPGSFDESFFMKGSTFCFPDYTDNPAALVFVGDKTNYKKKYLDGLSPEKVSNYSLDELERNFSHPTWEVRSFNDFVEDLNDDHFEDGINGKRVAEYFCDFSFRSVDAINLKAYSNLMSATDAFVQLGYFEKSDQAAFSRAATWNRMPLPALAAICAENGIKASKSKFTTVWTLVNNDVPIPLDWYHPTSKLIELYHSLTKIYLDDLVAHTNHFHPLYIESLWTYLLDEGLENLLEEKVIEYLSKPYWEDRLVETEK